MAIAFESTEPPGDSLDRTALGLSEVMMQSITSVAPAIGMLFSLQFVASLAGITAPLAFFVGALIALGQSISTAQLARYLPSAGGYYTYVSRTLSSRLGFVTSWLYLLFFICPACTIPFFGLLLQNELQVEYGVTFKWWWFFLIVLAALAAVMYLGISISGKVLLVLGLIEIGAVLLLSLWGIFDPGPGGLNLQPYNITHAPSANAFYLAVVFSIFGISGWEAAAPLAEEARDPRKTVPKALVLAVIFMMLFFSVCSYGLMIGWGTDHVPSLVASSTLPALVLGHQFWGSGWIIILLVLLNSTVAVSIACGNASTRALFGMARSGSLPKTFAYIHPRTKTPIHCVTALLVITAIYGLGVSIWIGADNIWYQEGYIFVPLLAFVYIMGNIGMVRMYLTTHRDQFNVVLHIIIPVIVSLAFIWVTYKTLYPAQASPLKWGPYIALGWGLIGCAILVVLKLRGSEEWLLNATETAEEIAAGGIEEYAAQQAAESGTGTV